MKAIATCLAWTMVLAAVPASTATAHHSATMYDFDQVTTIEGVVREFLWINPHVMVWIEESGPDGETGQSWQLENTSPGRLSRLGWNKSSLKAGTRVEVEFWPLRNGKPGGFFKQATNLDTQEILRIPEKS